jgi:hypothetical protein
MKLRYFTISFLVSKIFLSTSAEYNHWLTPLMDIISLYCENRMESINTPCGQNAEISMLKQVARTVIPELCVVEQVCSFPAIRTHTNMISDSTYPLRYIQGGSPLET